MDDRELDLFEPLYVIRVLSDGAAPSYLLKRLPEDRRYRDPDLMAPHDLCLAPGRSDLDELLGRAFTEPEAIEACRERHAVQPRLDVLMSTHPMTLVLVRLDQRTDFDVGSRLLRLVPAIGESGTAVEPELSVPAWVSDRADGLRRNRHHLFWRPPADRPGAALYADVTMTRRRCDGVARVASARLLHGESPADIERRLPCYESGWLASHYGGHDWMAAASSVMTVAQAQALLSALCADSDVIDLQLRVGALRRWLGSAEHHSGVASHPVLIEPAHHRFHAAVGVPVCWVVWPLEQAQ